MDEGGFYSPFTIYYSPTLQSQQARVVNVERFAVTEDGDDDAEADGGFGGRDRHHDEDEELPRHVTEVTGEGDERQVDGVEHQLDAHEHLDGVALDDDADHPDGEQHGRERQIPGQRNHLSSSPPARPAAASARPICSRAKARPVAAVSPGLSASSPPAVKTGGSSVTLPGAASRGVRPCRASVIAPTSAIRISTDVTSKGKRYLVNIPVPMEAVSPMSEARGATGSSRAAPRPIWSIKAASPTSTAASSTPTGMR